MGKRMRMVSSAKFFSHQARMESGESGWTGSPVAG